MSKLNEDLRVGLRIVQVLKKTRIPMTSAELAKKLGTTRLFVIKIAQDLIKADLVSSIRGVEGGFVTDDKRKIVALEVAQALGYEIRDFKDKTTDMIDYKIAKSFHDLLRKTVIR